MLAHEHTKRSLVKAATFRAVVMCADFAIAVIITGHYEIALGFVLISNFSSTILYFLHERVWNKIRWGRETV